MKRVVLDASGLLSWFGPGGGRNRLRTEYEQGLLTVVAHRQLTDSVLAALAASGTWERDRLIRVASELDRLGFELHEPPIAEVAGWIARGLTADQARAAALASSMDLSLVTADPDVLSRAGIIARSS